MRSCLSTRSVVLQWHRFSLLGRNFSDESKIIPLSYNFIGMTLFTSLKNAVDFYKVFWHKIGSSKLPGGGRGILSFFFIRKLGPRWQNTSSVGKMLDELEGPSLEACSDWSSLLLFRIIHSGAVTELFLIIPFTKIAQMVMLR